MYGLGPTFWLKLILILSIFFLLLFLFNTVMRKLLKVEKKSLFSYNHLNEEHKSIDWTIRLIFLVVLLVGVMFNSSKPPMERIWFLETYVLVFIFIIAIETARTFMEWKYAENRNAYIFTLSQLAFITILMTALFAFDLLEWVI